MAWNSSGNLLASASDKGTVLRVHSMPQVAYGQQSLLLENLQCCLLALLLKLY